MITRRAHTEVLQRLRNIPAVAILGPRQAGKTTLALQIAEHQPSIYLDLQLETDRAKLDNTASFLLEHSDKLIVLDEVHRVPDLFVPLRAVIDNNRRNGKRNGQFVILGSASPELLRQSGESLAGRLSYTELSGIDLIEAQQNSPDSSAAELAKIQNALWLRGGFPDSLILLRPTCNATYLILDLPLPLKHLGGSGPCCHTFQVDC